MNTLREQIVIAAIPHTVFEGWTIGALERGAADIRRTAFDVKRVFPGGVVEAVDCFSALADAQMLKALRQDHHLPSMKIRERIATAVMVRLRQQAPHRESVRRAMSVYRLPWNIPAATRALYQTVDAIWREAGDTSTDYNFYTKRLLLSQVYTSTLSIWLEDQSPDLAETEAFLRRRIDDVMQIEKLKASTRDAFSKLCRWLPSGV